MPALATRLTEIPVAPSVAMSIKAREMKAQGHQVISLTVGEPDFATPPHAIEAANRAALEGLTKYPPQDGIRALKEAIQRKFRRENKLDYALNEIMVANGGKQIITNAFLATCDAGDEVLIPSPCWISYAMQAKLAGADASFVSCPQNNGFKLRPEDLEAAITPRTKWLVLNFPNNPTGAACSRAEMQALAEVLLRHPQVWIMSDDMYEHLVYDNFEFCTIAEVEPRLKDRVLTLNGVSKTYAMTGWRIGYGAGPKDLIDAINKLQSQSSSCPSSIGQAAAAAALTGDQTSADRTVAVYRERCDRAWARLNAIEGLSCVKPDGAFYLYPNCAGMIGKRTPDGKTIETDLDFVIYLLESVGVASIHGAAYGLEPHFRISTATSMEILKEGCDRIAKACAALR